MKIVKPEGGIKNPHAYAARSIRVGRKFPQSKKTRSRRMASQQRSWCAFW